MTVFSHSPGNAASRVAASSRVITLTALFHPFLQALIGTSFVVVLAVGGNAVRDGAMSLGQFVEFNLYLVRMTWPMIVPSASGSSALRPRRVEPSRTCTKMPVRIQARSQPATRSRGSIL